MKNEKGFQRDLLIYEFGILIQPFEDLVRVKSTPAINDYRIAAAKVQAGDSVWRQRVRQFTTFADDIIFNKEFIDIFHVPEGLWGRLYPLVGDPILQNDLSQLKNRFEQELSNARENFFKYLNRVPVEWEPVVFEANTPFTSYLRIRESLAIIKQRLHYFDRYLKPDFFKLLQLCRSSTGNHSWRYILRDQWSAIDLGSGSSAIQQLSAD